MEGKTMRKRIGFGHSLNGNRRNTDLNAGHAPTSTSMTSIAFAAGLADDLPDRGAADSNSGR